MKLVISKFILFLAFFLSYSGHVVAWTKVQIRGDFGKGDAGWNVEHPAWKENDNNDNIWLLHIDFSDIPSGDYYFKVLGQDNEWTGGPGGLVDFTSDNYREYNTSENTKGKNILFRHSNRNKGYFFRICFDSSFNGWKLEIWAATTLEMRDYADVEYKKSDNTVEQRFIKGRGKYTYFCTWSSNVAWHKPDYVDVFVVSNTETDGNTYSFVLNKLDLEYIPAGKGLIVASTRPSNCGKTFERNTNDNTTTFNVLREYLKIYSSDVSASYSGTSMLETCYEATNLPRFVTINDIEYANYLFGFYRMNKAGFTDVADNDFALGFWLSNGNGNTYANSAYFQISKADAELMGVGTSYDMPTESSAKPCFLLEFPEDDEAVVTGIRNLTSEASPREEGREYYSLDGRRLQGKPVTKGLYIHNGKKIILK